MRRDCHGLELTAPSADAVECFNQSLGRLVHFEYDMMGPLQPMLADEGGFPLAGVFDAYLGGLSTDGSLIANAAARFCSFLRSLGGRGPTLREQGHAEAASSLLAGDLTGASRVLAALSAAYPTDLLALAIGHQIDYLLGDSVSLRDRIGAALPFWHQEDAHFGSVLGMYAFGLEENGHWEYACDTGMRAAELDPANVWAVHAVAHAHESRSAFRQGRSWLDAQRKGWDNRNQIRGHIAWHYCLFMLETEDDAVVLDQYDRALVPGTGESTARPLVDASSLLWRLYLRGADVAGRFDALARRWPPRVGVSWSAFNDVHAVMSYVGAGDLTAASALIEDRRRYVERAAGRADNVPVTAEVGLPTCESLVAFGQGRYDDVVRLLYPIRRTLYRCGGSHAQRDVIHQTLLEAAVRGGRRDEARALVGERIAIRPGSPFNWMSYSRLAASEGDRRRARAGRLQARRLAAGSSAAARRWQRPG